MGITSYISSWFTRWTQPTHRSTTLDSIESKVDEILLLSQASNERYQQYRQFSQKDMQISPDFPTYEELRREQNRRSREKFLSDNHATIGQLPEMIYKYDSLLYYNRMTISIHEIHSRIQALHILRDEILTTLFGEPTSSFYLAYDDTSLFQRTFHKFPMMDIDRLFETSKVPQGSNYVSIRIDEKGIFLRTHHGDIYIIDPSKQKTILRVMYSIYMDEFYLYHIMENNS